MLCTACLELSASFLTSPATTEKPLPASPALAASIAAFRDSKLVCPAIWLMESVIVLTDSNLDTNSFTVELDTVNALCRSFNDESNFSIEVIPLLDSSSVSYTLI